MVNYELTPENVMEMGRRYKEVYLPSLSIKELLAGIIGKTEFLADQTLKEHFSELGVKECLSGLSVKECLSVLTIAERSDGFPVEEIKAYLRNLEAKS